MGMFSDDFGLEFSPEDMQTRATALSQKMASEQAAAIKATGADKNGLGSLGYILGANIKQAMDPNKGQSDADRRKLEALQNTTRRLKEIPREKWDGMSAFDQEIMYKRVAAEEAFRAGIPDVGGTLLNDVYTKTSAKKKQDLELEKLGYEVTVKKEEVNLLPEKIADTKWGFLENQTAEVYDLKTGKPLGRFKLDEKGNAIRGDGRVAFRQGEFTTDSAWGRGGTAGGAGRKLSPALERELVAQHGGVLDVVQSANSLLDIIEPYEQKAGANGQVIGWGGDLSRVGTNLVDNLNGLAETIRTGLGIANPGTQTITGKDGKPISINSADQISKEFSAELAAAEARIAPSFRQQGIDSTTAQALILQLANSLMRVNEPGAGRYSDNDFQRALAEAGDSLADPNKLRAILAAKLTSLDARYKNYRKALGKERVETSITPEGWSDYERQMKAMMARLGGKPSAPYQGGGYTDPNGQSWSVLREQN